MRSWRKMISKQARGRFQSSESNLIWVVKLTRFSFDCRLQWASITLELECTKISNNGCCVNSKIQNDFMNGRGLSFWPFSELPLACQFARLFDPVYVCVCCAWTKGPFCHSHLTSNAWHFFSLLLRQSCPHLNKQSTEFCHCFSLWQPSFLDLVLWLVMATE